MIFGTLGEVLSYIKITHPNIELEGLKKYKLTSGNGKYYQAQIDLVIREIKKDKEIATAAERLSSLTSLVRHNGKFPKSLQRWLIILTTKRVRDRINKLRKKLGIPVDGFQSPKGEKAWIRKQFPSEWAEYSKNLQTHGLQYRTLSLSVFSQLDKYEKVVKDNDEPLPIGALYELFYAYSERLMDEFIKFEFFLKKHYVPPISVLFISYVIFYKIENIAKFYPAVFHDLDHQLIVYDILNRNQYPIISINCGYDVPKKELIDFIQKHWRGIHENILRWKKLRKKQIDFDVPISRKGREDFIKKYYIYMLFQEKKKLVEINVFLQNLGFKPVSHGAAKQSIRRFRKELQEVEKRMGT